MLKSISIFLTLVLLPVFAAEDKPAAPADSDPKIQIALLLDTSNSMDGLIDQAKSQLWKMVNELATTKKDGKAPAIEIALYEYGNDRLTRETGHIRRVNELTADLDIVSENLFSLTTYGGSEYCGWAIKDAVRDLAWSESNGDLKLIIIAGNEPFNQGPENYRESCKTAIAKGIQVNTIFCGGYEEGVQTFWKDGAELADGKYFNIDQDQKVVHIPTPYDDRILELNQQLNKTYIGYGPQGKQRMNMQAAQDVNAATYGAGNARERASAKAKENYNNSSWDLVDAAEADESAVESLKEEDLPEEMKGMSKKEQKAFIENKSKERDAIRKEILELDQKAKDFQDKKRAEMAQTDEGNTLDKVMSKAMREQAEQKGFN
jgi:hypothetical protein